MPILDRTTLHASDKLNFLLKAAACQAHGDISSVSSEFNVSRKTVRKARVIGLSFLEDLLGQPHIVQQVKVDEPQIQRTIIALSITAPCSIRAIDDILPIIYPGVIRRFGYSQALQVKAQLNAGALNRKIDLSAVISIAIDEVGIDLASGFLTSLNHEAHRDGVTWAHVLNNAKLQGMIPLHIVKEGGTGMAKGGKEFTPQCRAKR
jgi:hypothetical protein